MYSCAFDPHAICNSLSSTLHVKNRNKNSYAGKIQTIPAILSNLYPDLVTVTSTSKSGQYFQTLQYNEANLAFTFLIHSVTVTLPTRYITIFLALGTNNCVARNFDLENTWY